MTAGFSLQPTKLIAHNEASKSRFERFIESLSDDFVNPRTILRQASFSEFLLNHPKKIKATKSLGASQRTMHNPMSDVFGKTVNIERWISENPNRQPVEEAHVKLESLLGIANTSLDVCVQKHLPAR